jgi:hypothetical protein
MVGCSTCGGTLTLRVGHIDSEDGPIIVKWYECDFCGERTSVDEAVYS